MRTYAVVGYPIEHSLSPAMHNAAFASLGMDCTYMAYRVKPEDLREGLDSLRDSGVSGFNVTLPHKEAVMGHLDAVSESCSLVGAANTVSIDDGAMRGHNTDMDGFLRPLDERGMRLEGVRVLLLGAGGAARAAAVGLARRGVDSIRICNRNVGRARNLSAHCGRLGTRSEYGPFPSEVPAGYDLVVNATSAGMGGAPFPAGLPSGGYAAYDMVYSPPDTDFLRRAGAGGARTIIRGWEMLVAQAEAAFEIWHRRKAPRGAMKRALLGGA